MSVIGSKMNKDAAKLSFYHQRSGPILGTLPASYHGSAESLAQAAIATGGNSPTFELGCELV